MSVYGYNISIYIYIPVWHRPWPAQTPTNTLKLIEGLECKHTFIRHPPCQTHATALYVVDRELLPQRFKTVLKLYYRPSRQSYTRWCFLSRHTFVLVQTTSKVSINTARNTPGVLGFGALHTYIPNKSRCACCIKHTTGLDGRV